MTNLEWLHNLSAEELIEVIDGNKCRMCAFFDESCTERACSDGRTAWLNAEHTPKIKPCPVCSGKMDIRRWKYNGYYLVCGDCGMHFGLDIGMAEQGIIEGGYAKKSELIDDWNNKVKE